MRGSKLILPFFVLVGFATTRALADPTPIPQFTGAYTETWESFPASHGEPVQYLPDPALIMSGAATISNSSMLVFDSLAPVGLGSSGRAHASDGIKAMSVRGIGATGTILFGQSVVDFGAFWGADTAPFDPQIGDPALITVSFYDGLNMLIGTQVFPYSRTGFGDGLLEWHGWSSLTPIKRITFTEDDTVVDGLQADPVPEPAAAVLFAFVGLALTSLPRNGRSRRSRRVPG